MRNTAGARNERAFRATEAMLAHLRPKEDAASLARELEFHFGSPDAMFRADSHVLEEMGMPPSVALLLNRLPELSRLTGRVDFERFPRLDRFRGASDYLIASFHGLPVERFYMFCLDERGKLREQVLLQEGTSDGALFNLRRMLSEAMRARADAVIVSHNHPGLTLRPSGEDLRSTQEAIRALTAVGIPLLDHVIVAGKHAVSLRQNGFIPAAMWLKQNPEHPLLRGWLEGADDSDE